MEQRYFPNPYEDYKGQDIEIDKNHIRNLMRNYIDTIIENTKTIRSRDQIRSDLYVGDAGIAFMFLRLLQANEMIQEVAAAENALFYINRAKEYARQYNRKKDDRCAFLCGNAGIYAVSAVISDVLAEHNTLRNDLKEFEQGFEVCKPLQFSKYGSDEILVGRAGFLSGIYWLNQSIKPEPFQNEPIVELCTSIVESGRQYSKAKRSPFPLMYQYHSTEYLGAAHGLCGILHMLLESPWFSKGTNAVKVPNEYLADIKASIDAFVALQESDGNFPIALGSERKRNTEKRLVHWCHGAPGVIHLLAKAYRVFGENRYLLACEKAGELIWQRGLLQKGPGICHGVAGNGYAFLILFQITRNHKYLYQAQSFAKFLEDSEFVRAAREPDRPYSLYEGLAGTVCFLLDLLNADNASFPFFNFTH